MNTMINKMRIAYITACLATCFAVALGHAQAQSPELVGQLTKQLSVTPDQATGGAGALFNLAKSRLSTDEFSKVAGAVPGMDGLLKAAPKAESGGSSALGSVGSLGSKLPGGAGGLASVAGSFQSLGLSPDMAAKFVPVMTKFLESKGGSSVGSLFAGAMK
jgi:hypothetical protein